MKNRIRNWIYWHGLYLWFDCPLTTKEAKREKSPNGWYVWRGIRWLWLTKFVWLITGHKLSYWKWLLDDVDSKNRLRDALEEITQTYPLKCNGKHQGEYACDIHIKIAKEALAKDSPK